MVMLHANDLLDQRIIQEGCFVPQYTSGSILDSITEMIELMNSTLVSRDLKIVLKKNSSKRVPKLTKFDKRRLQQVLLNLLSNSIKYSTKGSIEVKAQVLILREKSLLEVKVSDQGIGMNNHDLRKLFQAFAQLSNKNPRQSALSNGFGLSVCKKICNHLGGDISAESVHGYGTSFTFTMAIEQISLNTKTREKSKGKKKKNQTTPLQNIIEVMNDFREDSDSSSQKSLQASQRNSEDPNQDGQAEVDMSQPPLNNKDLYQVIERFSEQKVIQFQGNSFVMPIDASEPIIMQDPQQSMNRLTRNFLTQLNQMSDPGLLEEQSEGLVMYADDQFVNQQAVLLVAQDLGLLQRLKLFSNGQEVVEFVGSLLERTSTQRPKDPTRAMQPIRLLLLDINMPILDGLETLKTVKRMFEELEGKQLQRPMIGYLSQTKTQVMQSFIYEDEQPDFYLEKPIPHEELAALFELLRIK